MPADTEDRDERMGKIGVALGFYSMEDLQNAQTAARQLVDMGLKARGVLSILKERGQLSDKAERIVKDHYRARYPDKLGNFEVYERVGQGGMGAVYRGRQIDLDRPVAIKVLGSKWKKYPRFVERFLREARAVGKLNHPNIVAGYDAGHDRGVYYVAMEYVEGESLRSLIKRRGRLSEPETVDLAIQIARALSHAHEHGFVHRDVKPHNVLITSEGVAKLCDLGLVKDFEDNTELTRAGTSLGTIDYASPEQLADASRCDIRTDIYSLGVTMYLALTGELPIEADDPHTIAEMKQTQPPADPGEVIFGISRELRAVVVRCLAVDPAERFQVPDDLEAGLRTIRAPASKTGAIKAFERPPRKGTSANRAARRPLTLEAPARPTWHRIVAFLVGLFIVAALAAAAYVGYLKSQGLPVPFLDA